MKQTISKYNFTEAFRTMGRSDNFSYEGLQALFDHLEDYEEDTGEEIELDVIAICCDYTEYDSALEAAEEYGFTPDEDEDEEEQEEAAMDYLNDRTTVIHVGAGVIIQQF